MSRPSVSIAVASLAATLLVAGAAHADAASCAGLAPPEAPADMARWIVQTGCVTVRAAAAPDSDAPSLDVARMRAERVARGRAASALAGAVAGLPLGEHFVALWMAADRDAARRVATLLDRAAVEVEYHSDGGVVVHEAVTLHDLVAALIGGGSASTGEVSTAASRGGGGG